MKTDIIYGDSDYTQAVNYQHMYNAPMTLNVNGKKYILDAGTSDSVDIKVRKGIIYVLSVNKALEYIGLQTIDPTNDSIQSAYLDYNAIAEINPKLLQRSADYQIKVLSNYLN